MARISIELLYAFADYRNAQAKKGKKFELAPDLEPALADHIKYYASQTGYPPGVLCAALHDVLFITEKYSEEELARFLENSDDDEQK